MGTMLPYQYEQFLRQCEAYRRIHAELTRQLHAQRQFDQMYHYGGNYYQRPLWQNARGRGRGYSNRRRYNPVSRPRRNEPPRQNVRGMPRRSANPVSNAYDQQYYSGTYQHTQLAGASYISLNTQLINYQLFLNQQGLQSAPAPPPPPPVLPSAIEAVSYLPVIDLIPSLPTLPNDNEHIKEEPLSPVLSNLIEENAAEAHGINFSACGESDFYIPEPDIDVQEIIVLASDALDNFNEISVEPLSPDQLVIDLDVEPTARNKN